MLDLACAWHLTKNRSYWTSFSPNEGKVKVRNHETIRLKGYGTIRLPTMVTGIKQFVTLHEVPHTPNIMYNRIDVSKVRKSGMKSPSKVMKKIYSVV